ncbi:hypothetical protein GCM10027449_19940 [Sinomonas notoginsengisoli]|uniref:hypothetical protein n=1 Tax=Sinomonas notoginsengisoli TaxID=1457311 RepID=UPI001F44FBC3|nr:hypothetical protein [Sinomonas notoginsengisoli]
MSAEPHLAPPLPVSSAPPPPHEPLPEAVPPAVVATILATEHWSLLGTRGMLWNELMSRISIHLTVSSASLVGLALVAQATGFGTGFWVMAIGLTSMLLVLGSLTLLRVSIGSEEDHLLIAGMNRLRGAYRELAPGIEDAFVTSSSDDRQGVFATYFLGRSRPIPLHAISSTAFFLTCFNAMVAGALAALITYVSGGSVLLIALVGLAACAAYLVGNTMAAAVLFGRLGAPRPPEGPVAPEDGAGG